MEKLSVGRLRWPQPAWHLYIDQMTKMQSKCWTLTTLCQLRLVGQECPAFCLFTTFMIFHNSHPRLSSFHSSKFLSWLVVVYQLIFHNSHPRLSSFHSSRFLSWLVLVYQLIFHNSHPRLSSVHSSRFLSWLVLVYQLIFHNSHPRLSSFHSSKFLSWLVLVYLQLVYYYYYYYSFLD